MLLKKIFALLCSAMILTVTSCNNTNNGNETSTTTPPEIDISNAPVTTEAELPEGTLLATINTDTTFQTMIGFGAAYTWYSERMLKPATSEEIADLLFKDAKLTILRFKNEHLYHNNPIRTNAKEAQIYEMAKTRANEYGEDVTVLMSCWSPPANLKSNDIIEGSGTIKKNENGEYMYSEYGEWWADSVEAYNAVGVPIDYLSIQNECDFTADYHGMELSAKETADEASYAKAFLNTYNSLKNRFGEKAPAMLGPETMSFVNITLKEYIKEIVDTEPDSLEGIAFHLYVGGSSGDSDGGSHNDPESFNANFRDNSADFSEDYSLWQTEYYRGSPMQTATLINNSLVYGNLNAYVYWTGVWDGGKPGHDVINIDNRGHYYYGSTYWVLRHFSEFIRPGYIRVQSAFPYKSFRSSAFISPDETKLAVVLINPTEEEMVVSVPISGYEITQNTIYQTVLTDDAYDSGEYYNNLGSLGDNNTLTLKPMSVTTIDADISKI